MAAGGDGDGDGDFHELREPANQNKVNAYPLPMFFFINSPER